MKDSIKAFRKHKTWKQRIAQLSIDMVTVLVTLVIMSVIVWMLIVIFHL